jgi:NADP-dependent 3-hydroxy acid dehydrogenase YdfG
MTTLQLDAMHPTHEDPVRGKAILITGGTTGIGRATAVRLAQAGGRVLIFGRHQRELDEAMRELHDVGGDAHGITADVSRQDDIRHVFRTVDQTLGGIDILVNNAAVSGGSTAEGDHAQWEYVLETNLLGYIACAHEALARMTPRGRGHIVNIGSMSADQREPGNDVYAATKAAIQAFSESLRKSTNIQGIRITLIEPGAVRTPLQNKTAEQEQEKLEKLEMLEPQDIAECVFYCLSQPPRVDVVMVQIRPLKQLI